MSRDIIYYATKWEEMFLENIRLKELNSDQTDNIYQLLAKIQKLECDILDV